MEVSDGETKRSVADIPRGLRHRHPAFSISFTASSLNARVNVRRSMSHLRFHSYT